MSTRRAKQLIYGALYAIIFLVCIGILYFIFVRPFINTATVAQCTVSTCAPTSTAPLSTSPVSMFVTSPGHYTFVAQVLDTNPDFGSQLLNYQIDVYDSTGALIGSAPAQTFIYPNQEKYLVVPNIAVSTSVDHATLDITSSAWIASSTLGPLPQFGQQNVQTIVGSSSIMVGGQFVNANIGSYEQAIILAIFNDENGNVAGVSQTELDNIQPKSTNDFSVSYPYDPNVDPSRTQVIIYAIR